MPRHPRELSPTGIYHAIVRGINKSILFHSDTDRTYFLDTLKEIRQDDEYELYSYCLMNNHVHLLLKAENEYLQRTMKRILVVYAAYFNKRHKRVGHVFQDRYRSEVIDSEVYFKCCARYIHNNPVAAGIIKTPQDYVWSSYRDYIEQRYQSLIDTDPLLGCFSTDSSKATRLLQTFTSHESSQHDVFIDIHDDEMISINIQKVFRSHGIVSAEQITQLNNDRRRKIIHDLLKTTNISKRQLAKRIGINKSVVYKAFTKDEEVIN